jgi:RNA polymerase sigma factor (sigma-70 family)
LAAAERRYGADALASERRDAIAARLAAEAPLPVEVGADLALATACDLRASGAWEALIAHHAAPLEHLLRSRGVPVQTARAQVAELWGDLALPPPSAAVRTRLGRFGGRCSLLTWLGVVLLRRHIDRGRAARTVDLDQGTPRPARTADPRCAAESSEEQSELREAFVAAWRSLPARDAFALALRYGEGLALAPIARMLAVSVSRASRIVTQAERALAGRLRGRDRRWSSEGAATALREVLAAAAKPRAADDKGPFSTQDVT